MARTSARRPAWWRSYDPQVLWALMGINVVVYVGWALVIRSGDRAMFIRMSEHFLVSWPALQSGRFWTLLLSEFSHNEPTHLLFNMIALWVFGGAVHRVVGNGIFVHLYVVGAVLASLGHVLYGAVTGDLVPALGASGAIMTIAVVYAALFPKRILMLNFFIPVPAGLAVAGYIALDLFGLVGGRGGIAHAAHLGGALYGALFWLFWLRQRVSRRR